MRERARAVPAFEGGTERERAGVADPAGDGPDSAARFEQQVRRQGESITGEKRHRWLSDQFGEPPGERGPGDADLGGERGDRPGMGRVVV